MDNYRQTILQLMSTAPSGLHLCFNQMWYNLLSADDKKVESAWCQNMSEDCKKEMIDYFRQKGVKLALRENWPLRPLRPLTPR